MTLSDDATLAACGFSDSHLTVYDLAGTGLCTLKRPEQVPPSSITGPCVRSHLHRLLRGSCV